MKLRTDNRHSMLKGLKLSPRIMHIGLFLVLASSILGSMLSIYFAPKVYAYDDTQVTATWVDASTVTVNIINATITDGDLKLPLADVGGTFYDNNVYDDNANYKNYAQESDCRSQLFANPKTPSTARLRLHAKNPATGKCQKREEVITLKSTENANFWFEWVDKGRIKGLSTEGFERNAIFTLNDTTKTFLSSYDTDGCHDYITVGSDIKTGVFTQYGKNRGETECKDKGPKNHNVGIKYSDTKGTIEAGQGDTGLPNNNEDTGQGASSCESMNGFLGWIACPVIKSMSASIDAVNTYIQGQLQSDIPNTTYTYEDGTSGNTISLDQRDSLKAVWVRMRDLAYIILVPIMLVMVIGTAIGVGPFDAYTVKKALPRMVAGVIFIALSWYICLFAINVTNAFGSGIQGVIEAPFSSAYSGRCPNGITLACTFDGGIESFVTNTVLIFPTIAAAILIVWFFLGTMLLFLAILFGTLVLRRIFIIALVIISPLAILPWIFPSNNKLWKAWKDSFIKLLLVYPMIMILITVGHVFALIIDQTDAGGIANFLFKIAAYILPLAFVPAAFKFAGGAFATLTGMANDRSKGLFGGAKKRRQNHYKKTWGKVKTAKILPGAVKPNEARGIKGNRRGAVAARLQQLAHINAVTKQGILRAPETWRENIESAVEISDLIEKDHIEKDQALIAALRRDDLSGPLASILKPDAAGEIGIRERLKAKGHGVRTELVPDLEADGMTPKLNPDGTQKMKRVVYKDENGDFEVINEDALNKATQEIMGRARSGDRAGALAKALELTGTYSDLTLKEDGTVEVGKLSHEGEENLKKNIAIIMEANRKYSDEALAQVSVEYAVKGGTYYNKATDMFLAVESVTGSDGIAKANMTGTIRGMATNAGRAESGGGAFGASLNLEAKLQKAAKEAQAMVASGAANNIGAAMDIIMKRDDIQGQYQEHVYTNTPAATLFHASMKENYSEAALIPILQRRVKRAKAAALGKPKDSPEHANYMRALVEIDHAQMAVAQSKPAFAKLLRDKVMSMQVETDIDDPSADGEIITKPDGTQVRMTTVRAMTAVGKHDPVWQEYSKEWQDAESARIRVANQDALDIAAQQAQAEAAVRAAEAGRPGGPGPVPPPGGRPPGARPF